jgi:glycine/D-amino acid oxidase-like deaminating enzyme/nitrite reductase/ring-hydroxylating ferredoxin subunit
MTTARTLALWDNLDDLTQAHFKHQSSHMQIDVIVIGAGIAGLTTALMLREQGREVLVVDRKGFGGGESLRTTAHLASALDDRYYHLQRWHGEDGARIAAQSHAAAIDWIEQFCHSTQDCDFVRVPGLLFAHDGNLNRLRDEADAARTAGLNARLLPDGLPAWPQLGPVLEFPNQARVDMGRLMRALAEQVVAGGVDCLLANATEVEGGQPATVLLEDGARLDARAIVVATHTPFHERVVMHTKQAAYRTYVVAAECARDELPDALVWDDADPYHYVRWVADGDTADNGWAIVGGEDHKTGQDADPTAYVRLQEWASAKFPALQRFTHAWSGQIMEPADGLAYIGADPGGKDHVYLVTGDSGNGVTHGVIAGLILSELVQGREHPWAALYDPGRKPVEAGATWVRENVNVAAQYTDWVTSGDVSGVEDIALGEGAILRRGLQRLAIYRSGDGTLHSFSARCPHLGCAVRWSPQEKSWDCPCHGSRFDPVTGEVLNGPAQQPLSAAKPRAGKNAL